MGLRHKIIAISAFFYSIIANAQSLEFNFSNQIDAYATYQIQAKKEFKITAIQSALLAGRKPIKIEIVCGGKSLGSSEKFFDERQLNKVQTLSTAVEITATSCTNSTAAAIFTAPGLIFEGSPTQVSIAYIRLSDEGFYKQTSDELPLYTDELVAYSSTLSEQAASQETLFCIIGRAEARPTTTGLATDLKSNYANVFGVAYTPGAFQCPPQNILKPKIDECLANPRLRTPFCNTTKLYNVSKAWFLEKYQEVKVRRQNLSESSAILSSNLEVLSAAIKAEIQGSDALLGIATELPEE